MATVLVVGATGVLAPAAHRLAASGHEVLAVSRRGGGGTLAIDGADPVGTAAALAGRRWDDALVYTAVVSADTLALLAERTPGRLVRVQTSDADDAGDPGPDTLQLGWTTSTPHRWHTPEEISVAALRVWSTGRSEQLGATEPESDRP